MNLIDNQNSLLLLVDMQEKLLKHIYGYQQLHLNCLWLLELAKALNIPIIATEQYPDGLGETVPELRKQVPSNEIFAKVSFSCAEDKKCQQRLTEAPQQIIVIGIEAHVCVLQSAIGLAQKKKQVFVVADAVSSRNPDDVKIALDRMRHSGVQIVTKEMVFFEWLRSSKAPQFKELSKRFLQTPAKVIGFHAE